MRDAGRVVTREDLMSEVWDVNWFGSTKTLDVHIGWLRQQARRRSRRPRYIHTVRGVGFRFAAPEEVATLSLRVRLLLALAYVLVLAIVALEVPLALQLSGRVDTEVRSQATSQADVVAATAAELARTRDERELERLVRAAARAVRGRVVIVDRRGRLIADSAGRGARQQLRRPARRSPPR